MLHFYFNKGFNRNNRKEFNSKKMYFGVAILTISPLFLFIFIMLGVPSLNLQFCTLICQPLFTFCFVLHYVKIKRIN